MIYSQGQNLIDLKKQDLEIKAIKQLELESGQKLIDSNGFVLNDETNLESYLLNNILRDKNIIEDNQSKNNKTGSNALQIINAEINGIKTLYTTIKTNVEKSVLAAKNYLKTITFFIGYVSNIYKKTERQSIAIYNQYQKIFEAEAAKLSQSASAAISQISTAASSVVTSLPSSSSLVTQTLANVANTNIQQIASQMPNANPSTYQNTINELNTNIENINNSNE